MQPGSDLQQSVWCVVPVYNNAATAWDVVAGCRSMLPHVLVVDDGSTDCDLLVLLSGLDVAVVKHERNLGKGAALLTASRYIEDKGGTTMITVDADGQHDPRDMERFFPLIASGDSRLIIGCRDFTVENVPASSRFGRKLANFWLKVETGAEVDDCQSGFRAYPVRHLNQLHFKGNRYDFEAEVLAKAAWAGLELVTVPVSVHYPRPGERVSSFRLVVDNLRLARIHSMLVGRRLLPRPHKRLVPGGPDIYDSLIRHPGKALRKLLQENATPEELALAAALGAFIGVMPLPFGHSLVILFASIRLKLNKVVALNAQHIAMPPFVPALCIEVGYYLRHGTWLTDLSFATVFAQFSARLYEWLLGSLLVAPLLALLAGFMVFCTAFVIKKARCSYASKEGR